MPYVESIILYCLKQLNGERTIFSIYHLLKGKKSSQTIQDAHLFGLTTLFGVYQDITRESLETVTKRALTQKWIIPGGDSHFLLTTAGEDMLQENSQKYPAPTFINGWKYHGIDHQFWERLSLLVQVSSNLAFEKRRYLPVQKNKQVHSWVKSFLKKSKLPGKKLAGSLFSELVHCLEQQNSFNPSVLIFRLTGYRSIGLTSMQVAEMLNMEFTYYQMQFINVLHYMIEQVTADINRFPILASMFTDNKPGKLLTNSSQITYELLKKGHSINEIADIRGLKPNTVEDHIVEIALNVDEFSIDPYIEKTLQHKILAAVQKTSSKQLKLIRNNVKSVNYFEIRLVLAKYGVGI